MTDSRAMITAADTNVMSDILISGNPYQTQSLGLLQDAQAHGVVLICDIVYAELVYNFTEDRGELEEALQRLGVLISPIDTNIAYEAGIRWAEYRRAGGPRTRILADFIIGAHAVVAADAFLTRDRGFYQSYFPELRAP